MKRTAGWWLFFALMLAHLGQAHAAQPQRWLLVDTQELILTVYEQDAPLLTLHNLAIGRYGASANKRRGDNTTPLGRFRITGVERRSAFHRFVALSYPDQQRAEQAYRDGLISEAQYRAIVSAHADRAAPPQNTPLGGQIGIHGLGEADPTLHRTMNWTKGCVALTDEQLDALLPWVRIGMLVEIR